MAIARHATGRLRVFGPLLAVVAGSLLIAGCGDQSAAAHRPAPTPSLAVKGAPTFSRRLLTGDTYAYTFDRPGAFGFVCIEHPATRGVVVVTSAGS